ncbi:MAG: hypothetical protein HYU57_07810 [Micavibrio aeruginosavorus]|nr:hypothetical protein [Micavibrio aeruginosavorus]
MKHALTRRFMIAAVGTPLLVMAAPGKALSESATQEQKILPADATNTYVVRSEMPKVANDGMASIIIDLRALSLLQLWTLAQSEKTAIIFRGDPKEPERLCPHFDLSHRSYEVRQMDPVQPIYRVKAKISKGDLDTVAKAGCLITRTIKLSEIKPYQPDQM